LPDVSVVNKFGQIAIDRAVFGADVLMLMAVIFVRF
jgi:hypothetical protein